MEILNFKVSKEDRAIIEEGAKLAKTDKHRKNYSAGSFAKESALNRAKRLIAQSNKDNE